MSYILDALRRADAERARGTVPGIHAQPTFAGPLPAAAGPSSRGPSWATVAAVLALVSVLLAVALWYGLSGNEPSGAGANSPGLAAAPGTAPPALQTRATPAPTGAAALVAPVASVAVNPEPAAPRSTAAASASRGVPPRAPVASAHLDPKTTTATARDGPAAARTAASSPTQTAAPRVYALNELPDDVRRGLPTLNVGGSMYSTTPADRVLILNGLVLHEGDHVSPDLQLLQIQLKSAVLGYRGYRYAITY